MYRAHRYIWKVVPGSWLIWSEGCEFNYVQTETWPHIHFSSWTTKIGVVLLSRHSDQKHPHRHRRRTISEKPLVHRKLLPDIEGGASSCQVPKHWVYWDKTCHYEHNPKNTGDWESRKRLFSWPLRNNPCPWAHMNIALVCFLLSPKVRPKWSRCEPWRKVRMPKLHPFCPFCLSFLLLEKKVHVSAWAVSAEQWMSSLL